MKRVLLYSLILIAGIILSQIVALNALSYPLKTLIMILLGYIMIEIGLEFSINKHNLKGYGKDYLIASVSATLPWILCSLYFFQFFAIDLSSATLIARFAAPTSAGVLLSMLAAAGLATTWVFKKARILAILDDLDTIILIVPLQMIRLGVDIRSIILIGIIALLLVIAWRYQHLWKLPTSRKMLFLYSASLVAITECIEYFTQLNIEILLPAFVLGCVIRNPHLYHDPTFIVSKQPKDQFCDDLIKLSYLFLVGCSLPQIQMPSTLLTTFMLHVIAITFLSNLGKLYPLFCYKKEASLHERAALSIAMWPRGEVGAGVLMISLKYALPQTVIEIAEVSLALNLALTGLFIYIVMSLLKKELSA